MSRKIHDTSRLGDHVLAIDNWSSRNGSPSIDEFEYIDIASVDREKKTIVGTILTSTADAPSRARQIVRRNDVLVSTVRPNLNAVAVVPEELCSAVASTGFCVLRSHPERLCHRYLYYWVRTPFFVADMGRKATGASYPAVSDAIIKDSLIPLPPLSEQKRIADILDKADTIRRKRLEAIDRLLQIPGSTFHAMFGTPAHNTKGWKIGTIRDLVEDVKYGSSSKAGAVGKYPMLRMNNITYEGTWNLSDLKYVDLEENELPKYLARKGDILFNRTNSKELVGKSAVFQEDIPMAFAGYLVRARTNKLAHPDYISGYLNSPHGKATLRHMCKNIVGMANINAQEFQDILIPQPPIEAQLEYVRILNGVRESEKRLRSALMESVALFDSLGQRAFKGEL